MLVADAIEYLHRSIQLSGSRRKSMELAVAVQQPGCIGPTAHARVLGINAGID